MSSIPGFEPYSRFFCGFNRAEPKCPMEHENDIPLGPDNLETYTLVVDLNEYFKRDRVGCDYLCDTAYINGIYPFEDADFATIEMSKDMMQSAKIAPGKYPEGIPDNIQSYTDLRHTSRFLEYMQDYITQDYAVIGDYDKSTGIYEPVSEIPFTYSEEHTMVNTIGNSLRDISYQNKLAQKNDVDFKAWWDRDSIRSMIVDANKNGKSISDDIKTRFSELSRYHDGSLKAVMQNTIERLKVNNDIVPTDGSMYESSVYPNLDV